MHYYGTRLSENICRREPEGYLLCLNVPVARTGTQDYSPDELGVERPPGEEGFISVLRPESEVFSPETMASFEGMPVTNDHPPEEVDSGNIRAFQKGHAHNIRRGSGAEADLLLADLIITDPGLIEDILLRGKREISCGYTYELCRENGRYIQRQIRGNHVAVVDAGRAGHRVCIRDRKGRPGIKESRPCKQTERRKTTMKKAVYFRTLARMAKDGDMEAGRELLEQLAAGEPAGPVTEALAEVFPGEVKQEEEQPAADEEGIAGVIERLDRIIALLQGPVLDEAENGETPLNQYNGSGAEPGTPEGIGSAVGEAVAAAVLEAADPMAEEIAAMMEEMVKPGAGGETEAAEPENAPEILQAGDAVNAALCAVKPILDRMTKAQRVRVAADISSRLRTQRNRRGSDGRFYNTMGNEDGSKTPVTADLGRRIMEKRNPNYRK